MVNLAFRENYWDYPELKQEFKRFLVQMFRVDLSQWDMSGFWDYRYRPFSYFNGDTLVSNVCIYSMDMTVRGEKRRVAQISGVGTLQEYRRRGLSLKLNQIAMEWARANHDFFFLFADEDAHKFYKVCGFRLTDEYKARIAVTGGVVLPGAEKLDMQRADHVERVYRLASDRDSVSDILGVHNSKLFMFWSVTYLNEYIHHISAFNILILYKRVNGLVTIYDIVGATMPTFAEIYPYICHPSDEAVEFLFMVDKLNLGSVEYVKVEGNGTHLFGDFPLEGDRIIFPFTSQA
jgi:GNAT superfamily N-acetyltransferase